MQVVIKLHLTACFVLSFLPYWLILTVQKLVHCQHHTCNHKFNMSFFDIIAFTLAIDGVYGWVGCFCVEYTNNTNFLSTSLRKSHIYKWFFTMYSVSPNYTLKCRHQYMQCTCVCKVYNQRMFCTTFYKRNLCLHIAQLSD